MRGHPLRPAEIALTIDVTMARQIRSIPDFRTDLSEGRVLMCAQTKVQYIRQ